MSRVRLVAALAVTLAVGSTTALLAEVKTQQKTQVKFEGMLGRMMGMFGGKAAKEGVVNTVAVKGNRKITIGDAGGQIIDLDQEKIYELNVKDKSYKVVTFDEYRKQLQKAQDDAAKAAKDSRQGEAGQQDAPQMEVDFDVKETGQKRAINGFDCRQVVATVTVRQKGATLDEAGGMLMTSDMWLGPKSPAMKEVTEFDIRFMKALGIDMAAVAQGMAAALAMYPGLSQAQSKFASEAGKLDGTPILTTVTFESARSAQQSAQAAQQDERPSGVGGMLGGLGRRIGKKKDAEEAPSAGAKGRSLIMTSTSEVLSIATSVAAGDLDLPAGFRQK